VKTVARLFAFLLLSILASCRSGGPPSGLTVFRYNEAANISTLDPAFARDQTVIWAVNQIFNGLVQLDDRMIAKPCIARSWMVLDSGRSYQFRLRNDVFFHDDPVFPGGRGRRVVAGDFVYSFGRIIDPAVASPGAWIFNDVDTSGSGGAFLAPDDSTLVVRLRHPFPPFLCLLSMQYCSVVPHEVVRAFGADFGRHPVGTGPFAFRLWQEGVKLVLLKNKRYFEYDQGSRLPYLDAVAISFVPDRQSAFLEFVKGRLDMMSGLDPAYKDELLTRAGQLSPRYTGKLRLITQPYLNTEYLGFMMDTSAPGGKSVTSSKAVRQAVNLSFDRRKMIRYLRNNIGIPGLQGIIPKGLPSYDSTLIYYDYDPGKARILLAEAGFPGGRGLPPITLTSTPDYLDICKYIQHQAAAVGIDLRIDVSPAAAMKEMKAAAQLPFFRASWIADYPDGENYLSLFLARNFCPKGPNYTHFSNPRFDHLYDLAMKAAGDSARFVYYREMEKILMEESPVIVLYYDQVLRFVHKNITGLGSNPMNLLTLKYVKKTN